MQAIEAKAPNYQTISLAEQQNLEQDVDSSPIVVESQSSKFSGFNKIVKILLILAGVAAFVYVIRNSSTNGANGFSALQVPAPAESDAALLRENEELLQQNAKFMEAIEAAVGTCANTGELCIDPKDIEAHAKGHSAASGIVSGVLGVAAVALPPAAIASAIIALVATALDQAGSYSEEIANWGTNCNDCCEDASYWYGKAWSACGPEPCWEDGSLCGIGTTCNACCNKETYWVRKLMTACGEDTCWSDGTLCLAGTTCESHCCNDYGYWFDKAFTACGQEPCFPKGKLCFHGSSCNRCCNGAEWSKCT